MLTALGTPPGAGMEPRSADDQDDDEPTDGDEATAAGLDTDAEAEEELVAA